MCYLHEQFICEKKNNHFLLLQMSVISAEMETTTYSHTEKQTKKITICFKDDPDFPTKLVLHFGVDPNGEAYFSSATVDGRYVSDPSKVYPFLSKQEISLKMDQIVLDHAKDVLLKSIHQ